MILAFVFPQIILKKTFIFGILIVLIGASASNGANRKRETGGMNVIQVPTFIQEPPSHLLFSNDTGSQISCSAHGNPQPSLTWLLKDGSMVTSVSGLRQTLGNGTMFFPPFLGQYYRPDIHDGIYRCQASNQAGTIISREVYIRGVVRQAYNVKVEGREVYLGNSAFLRCTILNHVQEFVKVISWHFGDEVLLQERSDIGGRFIVTTGGGPSGGGGDLYIRNVRLEDGQKRFSCLTVNTLTGERVASDSAFLSIKELPSNTAPRTNQKLVTELASDRGSDIHLPCNIQGNPLPIFTWYRISDSGALYPIPSSQRVITSQTLLFIRNADDRDSGRWICKASNQYGDLKVEIKLDINSYLSVHIHPQIHVINSGGGAIFNCSVTGTPVIKVDWYHDGKIIPDNNLAHSEKRPQKISFLSPTSLRIEDVGKDDRGIYQCVVSNTRTSTQASAELKLGDTTPELMYTFIEQNVRPGPHISLKCSASGSPPPQFTWLLDSQPIVDVSSLHRYAIGQFVDMSGDVISHLNISHVRTDDGGLYKCVAANSIASVSHSARLNIYGPPYVRAVSPVKAVAGEDLILDCPFSGYPIDKIKWERAGQEILSNSRYFVAGIQQGGALKISQVDPNHDAGIYTCIAKSRNGEEARRDIQLIVNNPPVIDPFNFPKNLQEGGRAQVSCSVSSGDMPVYFSWHKDNAPIPLSLQVMEKKEEFYTLLIFKDITSRHSGKYTCFATNSAAKVSSSAEMMVKVPPIWTYEPQDTAVMLGNPISIYCEANGYPQPKITWYRGQGKTVKDFHSISLKNNTLSVNFATSSDEGYYMCQAGNDIGPGLKKIIHVNVNEPARFEHAMKNISSRRNDPVILSCLAMGDEPLNIMWTHNNARIDLNNYRLSIAEIKTDSGINSQLSISRSDRQDSGKYKCIAENPYGRNEHIIYLAVQERPDSPSNLEILEVGSRTVKLSWKRPFDGNSPVLSYLVQHQPLKSLQDHSAISNLDDDWRSTNTINVTLPKISGTVTIDGDPREQAVVSGLHPATTYLMRMLAVNEIERSSFTDPIVIKTQEEAPIESPHNIQVQTGGMGELIITWQIPQKNSWNGEIMGYTVNCTEEKQNINFVSSNKTGGKSITVHGWATTKVSVTYLRKYTRYAVRVRAFNSVAPGPWSLPVIGTTIEGVPEAPPGNVNCSALSSQSIKISWQEPPAHLHGGVIQGYKILYRPLARQYEFSSPSEVKRTSNLETYLHALLKATNYSIKVLAYTSSGDGMSSNPIFCNTEEDVPDAPANIKASALTADSILISWLTPVHRNGMLIHYTVYSKEFGRKGQSKSHLVRVDEFGKPVTFEARGLSENQKYEFWVTASTAVGEGEPTAVVSQTTNTRAPARIASFSQTIKTAVGTSLLLECLAVGNPTPRARWITRDRPVTFSPFYEVTSNGNLKIHSVEPSLSGNYTCSAKNLFGEDEIYYNIFAMKTPGPPQVHLQYSAADSIRIRWENAEDGGAPIQGFTISYKIVGESWFLIDLTPEQTGYTINGLKCGTQYAIKMSAHNKVGDGQHSEDVLVWTKGKVPQPPDEKEFIRSNSSCVNLQLSTWNNGGCPISHFSIEHRPLGEVQWTVVSSDMSNSEDNKDILIFCDFLHASWYQLKIAAVNDAGKTVQEYNFATLTQNGETIPTPAFFPSDNGITNDIITMPENDNLIPKILLAAILAVAIFILLIVLHLRGSLCSPSSEGYESRAIPIEIKDDRDSRRNQQVYTASPVKMIDKDNESEMYEISPYATFSVSGGRTNGSQSKSKTPTRSVTASTLDYTVQFKTFGHPEGENLNSTAYPILPNPGFGHVKGKSSWHKQRYYNTDDDDSTLSKSMTVVAGSSRYKNSRENNSQETRLISRNLMRSNHSHEGSESDNSLSPVNDFSSAPTYRVPVKSSRDLFRPDSSTESNNDNSPIRDRRSNTPRHLPSDVRTRHRQTPNMRDNQSIEALRAASNNSSDSEANIEAGLKFCPPSDFTDSQEFSDAECDRERALDLEVQRTFENEQLKKIEQEELASLLARYQEKKEKERQEYTIHV